MNDNILFYEVTFKSRCYKTIMQYASYIKSLYLHIEKQQNEFNGSQLAKMKKSIPVMPLP